MLLLPWYNTGCYSDEMGFFVNHLWDWLTHVFHRIWAEMEKGKKSWFYNIGKHEASSFCCYDNSISSRVLLEIHAIKKHNMHKFWIF